MKRFCSIPSFLLTERLATQLGLENQHLVILIPKSLIDKYKISSDLSFDLIYKNKKLSLESIPEVETTEPPAKEVVT